MARKKSYLYILIYWLLLSLNVGTAPASRAHPRLPN